MLEKQHRFFDLVQRLLNPTLVLAKITEIAMKRVKCLWLLSFDLQNWGVQKMWQVAQRLISTVTPVSEHK